MTYEASEISIRDGAPIELFKFIVANQSFLYTSQEKIIVDGIDIYEPIPIKSPELEFEDEVNKSNITIELPRNAEIALQYIAQPPPVTVTFYLYRYHETDTITNKIVAWSGRVLDVTWSDSKAIINCESIFTSVKRIGLTRDHGANCSYTLYKTGCFVDVVAYTLITVIATKVGNVLSSLDIGLQADDYYTGGYVSYTNPGGTTESRSIIDHTGNEITIGYSIPNLAAGFTISILPGCKRNLNDCNDKFNNVLNYGGWPYNPLVNPFDGTTLF